MSKHETFKVFCFCREAAAVSSVCTIRVYCCAAPPLFVSPWAQFYLSNINRGAAVRVKVELFILPLSRTIYLSISFKCLSLNNQAVYSYIRL